jgi:hypothetical protein
MMDKFGRCQQPDHDIPKLTCGYPMPCPWHTYIGDLTVMPPTITVPVTAKKRYTKRMSQIAEALARRSAAGGDMT